MRTKDIKFCYVKDITCGHRHTEDKHQTGTKCNKQNKERNKRKAMKEI